MSNHIENFFQIKLDQLEKQYKTEKAIMYKGFYSSVFSNSQQLSILSIFHSTINDLFSFMNHKNNPGYGGHYNADESRMLLDIIEQIQIFQATTNEFIEYRFKLDDYYSNLIMKCRDFLTKSGGSSIPDDFQRIDIIEGKPIFTKLDVTEIERVSTFNSLAIQKIGGGSYATVFKYTDPHYETEFALKRAKPNLREDELKRFELEYKLLKSFDSPFIIKAYKYNTHKHEYTMEIADKTLEKFYKYNNASISFETRRMLVNQLMLAFEYIHSKAILHRDISYQNILIKQYEDRIMLKVCDFGLVKRPESKLTRVGTEVKGAINDYSDLDFIGFENYEIRHETYALSKVVYFLLTGRTSNYNKEKNIELKKFILRGIGAKEGRFVSVGEIRGVLMEKVFPSLKKDILTMQK
ncbi:protein kinase family protein [Bacillus sp. RO1]|uniref:protein kinase family protein n=1 Tax=Bacillus sp. RO1 TaxID=2722703 RepID=UPI0014566908|nr:protein kinase family protein [Bacillus sp. RO1]NLP52030.1 protein kinase [Bacillus sp. RO1]